MLKSTCGCRSRTKLVYVTVRADVRPQCDKSRNIFLPIHFALKAESNTPHRRPCLRDDLGGELPWGGTHACVWHTPAGSVCSRSRSGHVHCSLRPSLHSP